MVAQIFEYMKYHWIVHLKKANFMVDELYHNKAVIKKTNIPNRKRKPSKTFCFLGD